MGTIRTLQKDIAALESERGVVSQRENVLAGEELQKQFREVSDSARDFGIKLKDIFIDTKPLEKITEASRDRANKLRSEEADLAVMLAERAKRERQGISPRDADRDRAMLQKLDVQIQLQREMIRELRGSGSSAVSGEGN
jgi:hypothetical protein